MQTRLVLAVFVTMVCPACSIAIAQGTAGSGERHTFHIVHGDQALTISATYVKTEGGNVHVSYTDHTDHKVKVVKLSISKLSDADRAWIERLDPGGTCLKARSPTGTVGTLTPHSGTYEVVEVLDKENAIIAYGTDEETKWKFWLHSSIVRDLEKGTTYRSIPEKKAPEKKNPKTSGKKDFKVVGKKTHDSEALDLIEDN